MARSSIAVESGIAEQLSKLAEEKHMTLYSLTNQILQTSLEMLREDFEPEDLKNLWQVYRILRDMDAVVLPADFMDTLIADLYRINKDELLKKFYQLGRDVGKYLQVVSEEFDIILHIAQRFSRFFPLKKVESRYQGDGSYEISVVGAGGRVETTRCMYEALKGILEEYGATIKDEVITKGLIRVRIGLKSGKMPVEEL
ncbi:MAG: hypothetical protein QW756_07385 [Nitrososphaerota archaeon]